MKFNGNYLNPRFEVLPKERNRLKDLKDNLITELERYREYEREEILQEIENFATSSIQVEILERLKIEVVNNLAFNSEFYKEKCFYITENGFAAVTEDEQLFYSFVFGYKMQENDYKGLAVARNIIKVSLIDHLVKTIVLFPLSTSKESKAVEDVEVQKENFLHPVFKSKLAQQFFEQRIKEPGRYKRKFVSCLYETLRGQIKAGPYDFALYWNTHYSKIFEIKTHVAISKAGIDTIDEDDPLLKQIKFEFEDFKQNYNLNR